ncbi:hypothetical protein B0H16DRAFT_1836191 [Mycena metata]|uniref:BTB domain-containing protein n=1 Tax=Mycena metata TaxID=1033252 RepID=A0AAD7IY73_9AGAR|nr:hypothetical protein B0H16DRAFT_1836191 [Mycena metata]
MSQTPKDAPPPFSGAPEPDVSYPPDIIICSVDGVDLHVHRAIVGHVSLFFGGMFDIANKGDSSLDPDSYRDGKPVVLCDEPLDVLHRLLCIAFPRVTDTPLAAEGLDETVGEPPRKSHRSGNPTVLEAHPHQVYAIAHLRNLSDLARTAALYTLKSPVCPADLRFQELALLSALALQKLTIVSRSTPITPPTAITHAPDGSFEYVWLESARDGYHDGECGPYLIEKGGPDFNWIELLPVPWFQNHAKFVGAKLRAVPSPATAETQAGVIAKAESDMIEHCHACSEAAEPRLPFWAKHLAARVEASNAELATRLL